MVSLPQSGGAQSLSATAHQLPDTAALNWPQPAVDYKQGLRFAVVMYGGVSPAIYINGNSARAAALEPLDSKACH